MIAQTILRQIVQRALEEDLLGGDITTDATVDANARCRAVASARSELVVCGVCAFEEAFRQVDQTVRVSSALEEGALAQPGDEIWAVEGSTRSILMGERTALNFVQRMSGIATLARQYALAIPDGCSTRIVDTRKTTPGLRALERYAVRTGGAHNHRDSLGSAILIKDNHIAAAGGVARAIGLARDNAPHTAKIEIEVESFEDLERALDARADIVMLDNFRPEDVKTAVARVGGRALVEVSGRITMERVAQLARDGVDVISVGALTHSAPSADIGLDIQAAT